MKLLLFQSIISISLFFGIWGLLNNVNWISIFQIERIQENTEEKLRELCWKLFNEYDAEIKDIEVLAPLDSILSTICTSNNIDRTQIKLHTNKSDEISTRNQNSGIPEKDVMGNQE